MKIDNDLKDGLINGTDDNVTKFWDNIKELILEKLTQNIRKDRITITDQKMKEWIECPFPQLRIIDLAEYSSTRIDNIAPLIEYEQKMINSVS